MGLITDPDRAEQLARAGRERVRDHLLLPRLLLNEGSLMRDLAPQRPPRYLVTAF